MPHGSWHGGAVLAEAGFDIVHAFDAHAATREPGLGVLIERAEGERAGVRPLGRAGKIDPALRTGLLIGNTRVLWPRFLAARRSDPALAASPDPLDRYTEQTIERAYPGAPTWFAHRRYGGAFLPFQRLAAATGLGMLAPTQLLVHPIYGPWLALRAIVLVAGDPPSRVALVPPCTCGDACRVALAGAISATGPDAWRRWLAVRDACTVGRAYRYDDDQIAYHYAKLREGSDTST